MASARPGGAVNLRALAIVPWRCGAAGTAAVLEQAVTDSVPHVARCSVETEGPGWAVCRVRLRWYAWLTLGVLHVITWRRALRVVGIVRPAAVMVRVSVR